MITMRFKLDAYGITPKRSHDTDAGLDLYSPWHYLVPANGSALINTGVHIQLLPNTVGLLKSKSGLMTKHGITSDGTIDEGFTGEIKVKLFNHSDEDYEVQVGDRITQLVVLPVLYVVPVLCDEIDGGERGNAGYGSTGR